MHVRFSRRRARARRVRQHTGNGVRS
jgi:hypothetical protein